MMEKPVLTLESARKLIQTGHVVFPYPRKEEIKVDGFKTYSASPAVCKAVKLMNQQRMTGELPLIKLSVNPAKKPSKNPVEQDIGKSKYPHYTFEYSIQFDYGRDWATVAGTNNLPYAKEIAHMFAKKFPERTIRVSSEK